MQRAITQVGRILNRFSRDQYSCDESLPFQMNIFLAQVATPSSLATPCSTLS